MHKEVKAAATRVLCAGTFDHFHPGHRNFLEQARSLGTELVVIIARDENVKRIKGRMPDHDEERRKQDVEQTGIADRVILGYINEDLFVILREVSPDIVALGYDQRVSEESIKAELPACAVVRLNPFHPDKFKSSLYRRSS